LTKTVSILSDDVFRVTHIKNYLAKNNIHTTITNYPIPSRKIKSRWT